MLSEKSPKVDIPPPPPPGHIILTPSQHVLMLINSLMLRA